MKVRLLAHYERIADAPDAIASLRRFILHLAVRGRLVQQDPNDEPASELLKRIAKEKARVVKAMGPRKVDELTPRSHSHVNFPIPAGWTCTTLGAVANIVMGQSPPGDTYNKSGEGVPLINGPVEFSAEPFGKTAANQYTSAPTNFCEEGDLLICVRGSTTGRTNIAGFRACIGRGVAAIQSRFDDAFIRLFIWSTRDAIIEMGRGIAFPSVSRRQIEDLALALPPLAEQRRIVANVDELMALCNRLEAARVSREATRDRLAAASLARLNAPDPDTFHDDAQFALDALPALTARPDQIKQLRRTVLNLAVRGKLVPQGPNDEPATELLKRIAAEKVRLVKEGEIRKEKPLPPIQEDVLPFELPVGWAWARLGQLSKLVTSGSRDWAQYYAEEGAIFVRMGNLSRGSYNLRLNSVQRVKPPHDTEGARTQLETGDILVSITGEVGLLGLIPPGFDEAYINQHTCVVRLMTELQNRFIPELFRSPFAQDQFNAPQRGIKNSFRLTDVTEFLVPLPPFAEQRRIVAKIDELMALCNRLEVSLETGDDTRRHLLDALLAEALEFSSREMEAST